MKWISIFYVLLLGVITAVTVGFGLAAVYPQPMRPAYPRTDYKSNVVPQSCYQTPEALQSAECQRLLSQEKVEQEKQQDKMDEYQADLDVYNKKSAGYTRTAVFFGIVLGGLIALVALLLMSVSKIVATGLLFGGLLVAVLARVLVFLASVGAGVGTTETSSLAILEFTVLLVMLGCVVVVGVWRLPKLSKEVHNENPPVTQSVPNPPVA